MYTLDLFVCVRVLVLLFMLGKQVLQAGGEEHDRSDIDCVYLFECLVKELRRVALHVVHLLEHASVARPQRLENARVDAVLCEPFADLIRIHRFGNVCCCARPATQSRARRRVGFFSRGFELDRRLIRFVMLIYFAFESSHALTVFILHEVYKDLVAHDDP
jgi:hypothetical protein